MAHSLRPTIALISAAFLATGRAAQASPHETKLEDAQEICGLLIELAAHLKPPPTRTEWAEQAAFLAAHVDYPAPLSDLVIASGGVVHERRQLYRTPDEQLRADAVSNLVPPARFLAGCAELREAPALRSGAEVRTALGSRIDWRAGPPALRTDGTTASVTWRHEGFPFFFQLTLRRAGDGRFRIFATRAWPADSAIDLDGRPVSAGGSTRAIRPRARRA